jgi:transcriptional regulator with XRE-family HTH domain
VRVIVRAVADPGATMSTTRASGRKSAAKARTKRDDAKAEVEAEGPGAGLVRQLRGLAETVLGVAGPATDLAFNLAKAGARGPQQKAVIEKAGAMLKRMRESAGLTLQELAGAVDLRDPELIEEAERGKVALPFEMILRLASVLGRGDPISAAMKLTRAYNPALWQALEDLGVGRLVVQAGRERELANIYRGNDAARRLSDADFAEVLAFTKQAFDMGVDFRKPSTHKREG